MMPANSSSRWVVVLLLVFLAGCVADQRRRQVLGHLAGVVGSHGDEPSLRAAVARGEAALARESAASVWDGIELRVQDLSADNMAEQGTNIDLSARLSLRNPWEVAAERRARRAETDTVVSKAEQTALEVCVDDCRRSTTAAASLEHQKLYIWYREQLEKVLEWNTQCRAASTINELSAERLRLAVSSRLAERRPQPVDGEASVAYPLPEIAAPPRHLNVEPLVVVELIHAHAPMTKRLQASSKRYAALAQRANRRRLPWLDFVAVTYELLPDNDIGGLTGEVALEIPFGIDQRAESRRYGALKRSAEFEVEAVEQEQAERALVALRQLVSFEELSEQLMALDEASDGGVEVAARYLTERQGDPSAVAGLLDSAYEAREAVVEARYQAGMARCTLLETTGVPFAEWPRSAPTATSTSGEQPENQANRN